MKVVGWRMQTLAFDLGGTYLRSAVIARDGVLQRVYKQTVRNITDDLSDGKVWSAITNAILGYESACRTSVAESTPIVLAFPGPIAADRSILQAPTLAGSVPVEDIAGHVKLKTSRPVHLLNDVSSAAWHFAEHSSAHRFLVVTVSSGIGSKIYDRGVGRVLDDPPYAGEIGHYVVDDGSDALYCDCGSQGHLGGIASGRGIERAARRHAERDKEAFLWSMAAELAEGRPEVLTNEEHLVPAALAGDPWTWNLIETCTRPLARTILATIMVAGLDRVFIIGGFAESLGRAYHQLLSRLVVDCSRYAVMGDRLNDVIHVAASEEDACLKGCGSFIRLRGGGL